MVGTWNVGQGKPCQEALISWVGSQACDVDILVVGLQEVEMGAGFLAMSAAKETIGVEGSSNGQWWQDAIGKAVGEGSAFERVGSRQLAGLLIAIWVSMESKKFAFVRFSKVKNIEKLPVRVNVHSTSTFSRSFVAVVTNEARPCSFDKQMEDKPVMIIDDDCLTNKKFDLMLVAKVKSFDSMPNFGVVLKDEGFENVTIRYTDFKVDECVLWIDVEGVPLVAWTNKTFIKIAKRWGDMLFSEDSEDNNLWRKRLRVVTKVEDFIMESFKIIIKGKVSMVRAREIIGWIPNFMEEDNDSSLDSRDDVSDKSVSLNDFCSSVKSNCSIVRHSKKERDSKKGVSEEEKSKDPFIIYNLLNHNDNKSIDGTVESEDLSKPSGFSNFEVEEKVASENDEGRVNSFNQLQKNISNTKQNSNHVEIEQQVESNSNSVKSQQELLEVEVADAEIKKQCGIVKKNKATIFKVDFEKAYDSVKWDFLDMILHRFGFGEAWRAWIKGCLVSSSALILVNGSHEPTPISHLFYADDAVFIGEWREDNLRHLVKEPMIGCEALEIPFKYLGIMVGSNMNRLHAWDRVIEKVTARLSKWKAKTLSIGGRFTLTKSVLSTIPLYYFSLFKVPIGVLKRIESCRSNFFHGVESGSRKVSWFSWDSVVASKYVGSLGMSSFLAINYALLFKWIWRFKVQPDAMWVSIIKAIHRRPGSLDCGAKLENEVESDGDDVLPKITDRDTVMEEVTVLACDRVITFLLACV
nr:hypothetical protein [Tanacetum cinerariifolium]